MCIERRGAAGGTCLNIGCIPSKSLLHNSHLYHVATHEFKNRGILADNIRADLPTMMAAKEKAVGTLTKGIEMLFKKYGVEYVKAHGKLTGPQEVTCSLLDGGSSVVKAKRILLATGIDIDTHKCIDASRLSNYHARHLNWKRSRGKVISVWNIHTIYICQGIGDTLALLFSN